MGGAVSASKGDITKLKERANKTGKQQSNTRLEEAEISSKLG